MTVILNIQMGYKSTEAQRVITVLVWISINFKSLNLNQET
jgi:hypothetical protein